MDAFVEWQKRGLADKRKRTRMIKDYSISNINDSMEMKSKHDNSDAWNIYTRKMQRSPFMKEYLAKRHGYICPFCNKRLSGNFVIHHRDYDHECGLDKPLIELNHPTPKRPQRVLKVPDCEYCHNNCKEKFDECAKRVVPIHNLCNMLIEKKRKEDRQEDEDNDLKSDQ